MDYAKEFIAAPGSRVSLDKIDSSHTGPHDSRDRAEPEIAAEIAHMDRLRYLLYADGSQSLLIAWVPSRMPHPILTHLLPSPQHMVRNGQYFYNRSCLLTLKGSEHRRSKFFDHLIGVV
jgi:hypothetical protein